MSATASAPALRIAACSLRNDLAATSAVSLRSGKRMPNPTRDRDGGEFVGVEDEGHLEPIRGEGRARQQREFAGSRRRGDRVGARGQGDDWSLRGHGRVVIAVFAPSGS
jgi:hypothetical protein